MTALAELVTDGHAAEHVDLSPMITYKFGGPARFFVEADDAASVGRAVDAALADDLPYLVIGRGSNLVISDSGFAGLVIHLAGGMANMAIAPDGVVTVGAALAVPRLARACAKEGRGGLEFLVAVPGSVGGAVRMNAGCHGSSTAEWLLRTNVLRPGVGTMTLHRDDMEMTYRHNSLPETDIILGAEFRTVARPPEDSAQLMREITQWRKEHQPGGTFNAGSVFKNPEGYAAGWLIEGQGLKGFRIGGAKVSERHANFFEATAAASAQDVYDLVGEVRARVLAATGIALEPEIRFVGSFVGRPDPGSNNHEKADGA